MIKATDLYEILGVSRKATAEEIKSHYRLMIRSLHPDHGGDPDDFLKVQSAYDTLMDDAKRALYDSFGLIDANPEQITSDAEAMIAQAVLEHVSEVGVPATGFTLLLMRHISRSMDELRKEQRRCTKAASRLASAAAKIRRKGDLPNVVAERLKQAAAKANGDARHLAVGIAVHQEALKIAESYEFEDPQLPLQESDILTREQQRAQDGFFTTFTTTYG